MKKEYEEIVEETTVEEVVEEEEVIERPFTLRRMKDSDLMPLLQLLRKLGLKEFKDVFTSAEGGKDIEAIGKLVVLDIADIIIDKISTSACDDIYAFWSGLSGIPVEEIKEMEFGTLPLMIYDTFNEVKDTSFFKVLFKLL